MRPRSRHVLLLAGALVLAVLTVNLTVVNGGSGGRVDGPLDCALVLGAGLREDGTPSDVLRDRLDESLALYRAGRVRRILVSGDHETPTYDEPNAMRAYLEANGVPTEAVFMDHAGLDTYSSMWRAKHVFGAQRIIVVTQRFHLARALYTCRRLGLDVEGVAAGDSGRAVTLRLRARELLAVAKAWFDVNVHHPAVVGGPAISLDDQPADVRAATRDAGVDRPPSGD